MIDTVRFDCSFYDESYQRILSTVKTYHSYYTDENSHDNYDTYESSINDEENNTNNSTTTKNEDGQDTDNDNSEEITQDNNQINQNLNDGTTKTQQEPTKKTKEQFSIDDRPITTPSSGFNIYNLLAFCLLLAPLIMGFHISALFNSDTIISYFSVKMGYSQLMDPIKIKKDNFPSYLMPLGFLYPFGGMVGALSANIIVNNKGRKFSTYVYIGSVIIGSLLKFGSVYTHFALLVVGRFFDGIGSSGIMVTALVLMFEIMNDFQTKIAKPLVQILINLGIITICGLLVKETFDQYFYYTYLIPAFLGVILASVLFFLPESPVFIYSKYKNPTQTLEILNKLHGSNAPNYLQSIEMKSKNENGNESILSIGELFKNKRFRLATTSCILINSAQQLSGINAIMAFAPDLLKEIGYERPDLMALLIIASGLLGSILFAPVVTNFKRKLTLLIGFGVMSFSLTIIVIISNVTSGLGGFVIAFFAIFVFIFQIGPGPLVWFISMEVFPSNAIPGAQSLGVASNWLSNAIVYAIPYENIGINILILFIVVNIAIVAYGYLFMAETHKKSSEDILNDYEYRSKKISCC